MALESNGISAGRVFETFLSLTEGRESSFEREIYTDIGTLRKFIPLPVMASAMEKLGITFFELLQRAFPDRLALEAEEESLIKALELLTDSEIRSVRRLIRSLQLPWWDKMEMRPVGRQITEIALVRTGNTKNWNSEIYPILSKTPVKNRFLVTTDNLPFLCNELDVPVSAFARLPSEVAIYHKRPELDQTFREYKFLDPSLRPIILSAVLHTAEAKKGKEEVCVCE